ncbi:MAG: hypothetical protein LC689_20370 [Myxococcales bacterium]|nr:hypothetical protein [Myxococcales bacterium]
MVSIYLGALALSCFLAQLAALAVYVNAPGARRWMEPLWCFVNPALYLLVIEPAMAPPLPWFRALLCAVFAGYWTVRFFGELWQPPEWAQRAILVSVMLACASALVRGCLAVTANADALPYFIVIAFGGFSLYVIPMLMAFHQLDVGKIPLLHDRAARFVGLAIAAILGGNLLLAPGERGAGHFQRVYEAQIVEAARERGVPSDVMQALVSNGIAGRTPLGMLVERIAMNEWLEDPKSHFVVAPAFADVHIGPLQLTPRETIRAIRETGTPWTKQYREVGYGVPRVLPGTMPALQSGGRSPAFRRRREPPARRARARSSGSDEIVLMRKRVELVLGQARKCAFQRNRSIFVDRFQARSISRLPVAIAAQTYARVDEA